MVWGVGPAVVSERWQRGLGNPREHVRRVLLHRLVIGTATHSELCKHVEHDLAEAPYFDQILKEIADFRCVLAEVAVRGATGRWRGTVLTRCEAAWTDAKVSQISVGKRPRLLRAQGRMLR